MDFIQTKKDCFLYIPDSFPDDPPISIYISYDMSGGVWGYEVFRGSDGPFHNVSDFMGLISRMPTSKEDLELLLSFSKNGYGKK